MPKDCKAGRPRKAEGERTEVSSIALKPDVKAWIVAKYGNPSNALNYLFERKGKISKS
jgi:hypothetical protein